MIPLSVPNIKGNEWQYVKECLDTEWVSSVGKYVNRFEEDICRFTGAGYAVACVNGTAALQVALRLVGVQPGDEVIVPTLTFIAPVNAVRYLHAEPIFMDCDKFYNLDIEKTIEFITTQTEVKNGYTFHKNTGKRIPALVAVHVFGNPVNLSPLLEICKERNIKVVEDAAESIGSRYIKGPLSGKYTGTIGDIGIYSFNGNKIITTGGGGMIVTNNPDYAEKAKYLTTQAKDDPLYYIHNEVGYNFRLTNIQAAMGVAQLELLPEFIEIKKNNYDKYKSAISQISGLSLAEVPEYSEPNYWFYCLQIDADQYGMNRDELMQYLNSRGIQVRPIWHLNHLQKPYQQCFHYRIEQAFKLFENTINIPCSTNLTDEQLKKVVENLSNAGN
ncbi:MAG: LegC family aminotransferase [Methanobacteriota archaeon]|nr:MAG: LegC family aminotransferase [Euryarchaeota archaeon]